MNCQSRELNSRKGDFTALYPQIDIMANTEKKVIPFPALHGTNHSVKKAVFQGCRRPLTTVCVLSSSSSAVCFLPAAPTSGSGHHGVAVGEQGGLGQTPRCRSRSRKRVSPLASRVLDRCPRAISLQEVQDCHDRFRATVGGAGCQRKGQLVALICITALSYMSSSCCSIISCPHPACLPGGAKSSASDLLLLCVQVEAEDGTDPAANTIRSHALGVEIDVAREILDKQWRVVKQGAAGGRTRSKGVATCYTLYTMGHGVYKGAVDAKTISACWG